MAFRENSNWNQKTELEAFLIFKTLEQEQFPRGRQIKLCKEMAKKYDLSEGNISAKVSNYKTEADINNTSNASKDTIENYWKYKTLSIDELKTIIKKV